MKRFKVYAWLTFFILFMTIPSSTFANDPKDYIPAPAGTKAVLFYYNHTNGNNYYTDGKLVGKDTNLNTNVGILRLAYYGEVGSHPWVVNCLFPFGSLSLDGKDVGGVQTANTQIGDPILVAGIWPIANKDSKTWLGVSEYITVPGGEYRNDKTLNMGSNMWAFKTEFGFVKGLGNFTWDLGGNVELYTNNSNYTSAGLTLEKDPVYTGETHLTYDVTKSFWVSADYIYTRGGQTSVNKIYNQDKLDDHSVGGTLTFWLNPSTSLLIKYVDNVQKENGIKANTLGFRFAYFF